MIELNIKSNAKWTNQDKFESMYVIAIGGLGDLLIREISQKERNNDITFMLVSILQQWSGLINYEVLKKVFCVK